MENVDNDTDLKIDVELIDKCLHRMKTRKAPGFDGIDVEHILRYSTVIPLLCGCSQFYTCLLYTSPSPRD